MELFRNGLEKKIGRLLGVPVRLTLTNNRCSMVYVRPEGKGYAVRVHHMFLSAPEEVIRELARFIRTGRSAVLSAFINRHIPAPPPARPRKERLAAAGRYHDLQEIYDRLNRTYFGGSLSCTVTWGRGRRRGRNRRSIQFGSYDRERNLIRIHPRLDTSRVPRYFLEYIMFHEMLHAVHPPAGNKAHPPAFREEERRFPLFARARRWQKEHTALFIRG